MKSQKLFVVIIFTLICSNLKSQSTIGFKGGFTDAWPGYGDIELPENAETHIKGFNFSIFYFYEIRKNLAIGIEPGYVKRGGACFPGFQPNFIGDSKVFLNYIEFPLMIQKSYDLGQKGLKLNSSIGYGVSRLQSAYSHQEILGSPDPPIITLLEVDNEKVGSFDKYDHGAYFNLGLSYIFTTKSSIFLESSYYFGLKDYDKVTTSKNRSLNFNLGYSY